MSKLYKPNIYAKDIYSINYQNLKQKKITNLLFDIDNTIADSKQKKPTNETILLFNKLKKEGFNLYIITNSLPNRAKRFGKILNTETYYLSFKPLGYNYNRLIKKNNLKPENMAAIGDQLLTDIKGANKKKITSILIDKISNNESILTKINRLKENHIIKNKKVIKRGEYYE